MLQRLLPRGGGFVLTIEGRQYPRLSDLIVVAVFVFDGFTQGKFEDAAMEIRIALLAAADSQKSHLDGLVRQLEAKQDINQ